jgi:hypothetical protein
MLGEIPSCVGCCAFLHRRWFCHLGKDTPRAQLEPWPAAKEHHELVRTSPYAYVRHPIYTGLTLMAFGSALTGSIQSLYHQFEDTSDIQLLKPDVLHDNPEPHRFAQFLGSLFLTAGTIALYSGATTPGRLGAGRTQCPLVAFALAAPSITGWPVSMFLAAFRASITNLRKSVMCKGLSATPNRARTVLVQ